MNTNFSTLIGATALLALSSTPAFATDANPEAAITSETKVQTVRTIDGDNRVGELTIYDASADDKSAVLGAIATQNTDAYVVRGDDGKLYINHLIKMEDLPDPRLDVQTVEEYTYEYQGRIYTNRVTADQ